jgi:hypothetical protein
MAKEITPPDGSKIRPLEALLRDHAKGKRMPWWEFVRVRGHFQAKREKERAERGAGGPPRPLVAKLTKRLVE